MSARQEKITFAEMRAAGVRVILVYCSDYKCSHSLALMADQWPDDMRLSDIEPRFICAACSKRRGRAHALFWVGVPEVPHDTTALSGSLLAK
jgi:hypothetical protein